MKFGVVSLQRGQTRLQSLQEISGSKMRIIELELNVEQLKRRTKVMEYIIQY